MGRLPEQSSIAHNVAASNSKPFDRVIRENKTPQGTPSTSANRSTPVSWNVFKALWKWFNVSEAPLTKEEGGVKITWTTDESEALSDLDASSSEVERWIGDPEVPEIEDRRDDCKNDPLTDSTTSKTFSTSDESSCGDEEEVELARDKGKARECVYPKRRKRHPYHSVPRKSRKTRSIGTQTSEAKLFDDSEILLLALWTPLLLFDMENRDRITAGSPAAKYHEISKKVSEAYASLDSNEKEVYTNPTAQLIEKWYKRELYEKKLFRAGGKGYMVFAKETYPKIRAAHPQFTVIDINRYLGQQWRALDGSARHEYMQRWNSSTSF